MLTQPDANPGTWSNYDATDDASHEQGEVVQTTELQGLSAIRTPHVQLVTWQREFSETLQAWFEQLDESCLPHIRILIQPEEFKTAIELLLDEWSMPADEERLNFIHDMNDLVRTYAAIAQTDMVDVRLEHLDHDACWKYHRDYVELRLLTTYVGPSTEWVRPEYADNALEAQGQFEGPIEHFRLHEVGIFKGARASTGAGIVHRSPPISVSGQSRLLFCLNKPSEASPSPWSNDT